jgi:PmbA protein
MNEASGDFSCQAEGYLIEDGKITKPLNLITLSGNILGMLKDLVGIDKESKLTGGLEVGDALIKKMNIGGLESA